MSNIELFKGVSVELVNTFDEIQSKVVDVQVDDETIFSATDFTKKIVVLRKNTEAAKKESVEALKQVIAETEAPYKNLLNEIAKIETLLRDKILEYHSEKRRREMIRLEAERQEKLAMLARAQEQYALDAKVDEVAGIEKTMELVTAEQLKAKSSVQGFTGATSGIRLIWTFELIDVNQVPREFMQINEVAVRDAIRAGKRDIAGLKIYQRESVNIR